MKKKKGKGKKIFKKKDAECKHRWIRMVAIDGKKYIPAPVWVCTSCGTLRVGTHTIRISRFRLDMGGKPLYNASRLEATSRLKIPVGTNLYD